MHSFHPHQTCVWLFEFLKATGSFQNHILGVIIIRTKYLKVIRLIWKTNILKERSRHKRNQSCYRCTVATCPIKVLKCGSLLFCISHICSWNWLKLLKYRIYDFIKTEISQASEQERKGEGERLVLLFYISFKLFCWFSSFPQVNFISLLELGIHITGLIFSGKKIRGPLEKKSIICFPVLL